MKKFNINSKEIFGAVIAIVVMVLIAVSPNGTKSLFSTAGGGVSLKEMNQKKDTTAFKMNMSLQFNQTNLQNLEQGLVIGNFKHQEGMFFTGAHFVGGVSTEYGVCTPVMDLTAGAYLNNSIFEYKVGNFKRTGVTTAGVDAQYSNHCVDLGEGAGVKNAMQLSFIRNGLTFGFGHQGISSFYDFSAGSWYAYTESQICKNITLAGGVNFGGEASAYAAAKVTIGNNQVTATGNKLGTEGQNVVVTYNRDNISIGRSKMMLSASAWAKDVEQGLHLVASLVKGKGTFFAEVGCNRNEYQATPYCGVGTSFNF